MKIVIAGNLIYGSYIGGKGVDRVSGAVSDFNGGVYLVRALTSFQYDLTTFNDKVLSKACLAICWVFGRLQCL